MGTEKVRRNFSIREKVDGVLNDKADEWDMSRSEIVEKAVLEYTDHDRTARIEEKLDEIHDVVVEGGATQSRVTDDEKENPAMETEEDDVGQGESSSTDESLAEKYSDSDETSIDVDLSKGPLPVSKDRVSNQTRRKANKMFNHFILSEPGNIVPHEKVLQDSIFTIGTDNEYHIDEYEDRIKQRLEDAGWYYHTVTEMWYREKEMYLNHLRGNWEDLKSWSNKGRIDNHGSNPTEDLKNLLESPEQFQQELLTHGVAEESEVRSAFNGAENKFEQIREQLQ